MTKLPAWHRDATAPKAKTPKGRAMWATAEPARDPNKISDASLVSAQRSATSKPRKGLGRGLADLIEEGDKVPRWFRCIEDPSAGLQRMTDSALRKCPQCDKPIAGHPNKKFCGPKCKDRWHNTQNPRTTGAGYRANRNRRT